MEQKAKKWRNSLVVVLSPPLSLHNASAGKQTGQERKKRKERERERLRGKRETDKTAEHREPGEKTEEEAKEKEVKVTARHRKWEYGTGTGPTWAKAFSAPSFLVSLYPSNNLRSIRDRELSSTSMPRERKIMERTKKNHPKPPKKKSRRREDGKRDRWAAFGKKRDTETTWRCVIVKQHM